MSYVEGAKFKFQYIESIKSVSQKKNKKIVRLNSLSINFKENWFLNILSKNNLVGVHVFKSYCIFISLAYWITPNDAIGFSISLVWVWCSMWGRLL